MAKVPFSKFQAKVNNEVTKLSYCNLAGEEICYEVKHYIPFIEKLELVSRIINHSIDDNGFYNPMRIKYNMVLEVIYAYTNLSFTEKMKEDPFKLYDLLVSTNIFDEVKSVIGKEWEEINNGVISTIKNIYEYRNSVLGILEAVSHDYASLNLDANEIYTKIADPSNMELLKSVVSKLG